MSQDIEDTYLTTSWTTVLDSPPPHCYVGSVKLRVTISVVLMTMTALLGACTSGGSASQKPPGTPTPHDFGGIPTVGALFRPSSKEHHCTASVVASAARNILITAAHCVAGSAHGYQFAPGYHGGTAPFGSWTVLKAYGAPEWTAHQAPQSDVAFLVVAARQINGREQEIQDVTGANQLGAAPASGDSVTAPGYPNGHDDPVTCTARVYYEATYPTFNCDPYPDGTSGGPWLLNDSRGSVVVGVIGGLRHGGCSWAVYSSAFGPATVRTYSSVATGRQGPTFPDAGGSAC
jgi:V8-like Glu-specific endopeptidase